MTPYEQIAAARQEAETRRESLIASLADLHAKMQAAVAELNSQGVELEKQVISVEGEVKALKALEDSLGQ